MKTLAVIAYGELVKELCAAVYNWSEEYSMLWMKEN
jgi:hypothetical protein